jgi:hypothetical protein
LEAVDALLSGPHSSRSRVNHTGPQHIWDKGKGYEIIDVRVNKDKALLVLFYVKYCAERGTSFYIPFMTLKKRHGIDKKGSHWQ